MDLPISPAIPDFLRDAEHPARQCK
jgi:hypothetical protein